MKVPRGAAANKRQPSLFRRLIFWLYILPRYHTNTFYKAKSAIKVQFLSPSKFQSDRRDYLISPVDRGPSADIKV